MPVLFCTIWACVSPARSVRSRARRNCPTRNGATGRGFCRTLSSIVAISTPLVAAGLISLSGGINVRGIRSLYAIEGLVFVGILVLLLTQLRGSRSRSVSAGRPHILSGFTDIFKHGPDVMRLVLVMGLMELPWTIAHPFMPLYARDFKGADQYVLGGIAMALTIVPMLASILLGRLADRYGRKKLLFALAPLAYLPTSVWFLLHPKERARCRSCCCMASFLASTV